MTSESDIWDEYGDYNMVGGRKGGGGCRGERLEDLERLLC